MNGGKLVERTNREKWQEIINKKEPKIQMI